MEKFLYFQNSTTDSVCIPVRKLVEMEMDGSGTALDLRFAIGDSAGDTEYEVLLTVSDNTGTEVMKGISEAIRLGKDPFIVVADDTDSEYIHSSITGVASFSQID